MSIREFFQIIEDPIFRMRFSDEFWERVVGQDALR